MCAALTKTSFIPKKIQKKFNFKFIMQLFSANAIFFDPENMKKAPSKDAHNRPQLFFCTGPAAQMALKQKSCTTKSPLMQDWVFRLDTQHFSS